jgi:hypothetical protein
VRGKYGSSNSIDSSLFDSSVKVLVIRSKKILAKKASYMLQDVLLFVFGRCGGGAPIKLLWDDGQTPMCGME